MKKTILLFALTILFSHFVSGQIDKTSKLFVELEKMDRIIFDEGFNKCNFTQLKTILHKDLVFMHDQNGIQNREQFFKGFKESICSNANYKPIRKLVKGSLSVYPLKNKGKLYAAIQKGEHEFYISEPSKELYLTSTAKFTNVWFLVDGKWSLKRILSYDHQVPKNGSPTTSDVLRQGGQTANIVGRSFSIKSAHLKEQREIQVFLPDSYDKSDKKYPVVFVLDGQRLFLHGVSLQKSFVQFKQTPEFIVVGISSGQRQRAKDFRTGAKSFLEFLEKEVIVFVDKKFRTSEERLLFGWAFGGGFAIHAMNSSPEAFEGYIAASPFPINDKIAEVEKSITKDAEFKKFLYFTSGTNEGVVKDGTNKLNNLLQSKAPKTMNWKFRELEGEEHRSTQFITLYHGVKTYYKNYPELSFNSLDEFNKVGGMSYVYNYYKKRAEEFGFSPKLPSWTMFTITRAAMRAKHYDQFDAFVNEFKGNEFIALLSVNRASLIADFYLENEKYKKAIGIYSFLIEKHPKSARPLNGLGDVYKALNDEKRAAEFYRKAKDLIEKK